MVDSVRRLHPLDLLILPFFDGQANRALTWEGLGRVEGVFSSGLLWLRPRARRYTLVWARRGRIEGLISARPRRGPRAWEVDRMFLARGREELLAELLEHQSTEVGRLGVEKVFLRLPVDSPLLELCRADGFCSYRKENLYRFPKRGAVSSPPYLSLHPRASEDDLALFQLYNASTPPAVRAAEAMTLGEWQHVQEPKPGRELVYCEGGGVSGWLRLREARGVGQFDILVSHEDKAGPLVDYCLGSLGQRPAIYSRASEFHQGLARALEEKGGDKVGECFSLVKTLAVRVPQPQLVPLQA